MKPDKELADYLMVEEMQKRLERNTNKVYRIFYKSNKKHPVLLYEYGGSEERR